MIDRWWYDDDELLATLRNAMRYFDDVPEDFIELGRAAYGWRGPDAELAALSYDSADVRRHPVFTRQQPASLRALTFASTQLTIHIELTREAMHGQVVPGRAGEIEVCPARGRTTTVDVDEVGWFVIRPIPTQRFRLRCSPTGGSQVVTDWITL